jgi:hypothetical protein
MGKFEKPAGDLAIGRKETVAQQILANIQHFHNRTVFSIFGQVLYRPGKNPGVSLRSRAFAASFENEAGIRHKIESKGQS